MDSTGDVAAYGDAATYGSLSAIGATDAAVALVPTVTAKGYLIAGRDVRGEQRAHNVVGAVAQQHVLALQPVGLGQSPAQFAMIVGAVDLPIVDAAHGGEIVVQVPSARQHQARGDVARPRC